jgi:hypothetical protein
MDGKGRAKKLRIIAHNENKDVLREYLLDLDTNDRKYIFFFTDPEKACEL